MVSLKQVLDTRFVIKGIVYVPVAKAGRLVGVGMGVASYVTVTVGKTSPSLFTELAQAPLDVNKWNDLRRMAGRGLLMLVYECPDNRTKNNSHQDKNGNNQAYCPVGNDTPQSSPGDYLPLFQWLLLF